MEKVTAPPPKTTRREQLLASCADTRRQCNRQTPEQRQELLEQGLALIYGHDAKATARRR